MALWVLGVWLPEGVNISVYVHGTDIDSPQENSKTLYNILGQGSKTLKFVQKRDLDLTWRNPVDMCDCLVL